MPMGSGEEDRLPMFATTRSKWTLIYRAFACSVFLGICSIWFYRWVHFPVDNGVVGRWKRWVWSGLFASELWFGFYWIIIQASRWNLVYRRTFKDRLSKRYGHDLPGVDIFVCTADPSLEPPAMVVSTVLSVMAYDYPTEKLAVYLSDDAGSELTCYAMLEASRFARHWLPYCKRFKVETTSPAAFFDSASTSYAAYGNDEECKTMRKLYEEMEGRIDAICKLDRVPDQVRSEHREFSQWDSYSSKRDHDPIVQTLIDRTDPAVDNDGNVLPTLVYVAREKRPDYFHNFKAGAMNALIRVSGAITGGKIILNVDCDMYSNSSGSIRDALCFFMDEDKGHEIAFVQFPQNFANITKNELYGGSIRVISNVEFHGLDGYGGPMYVGSGCFHRRDVLCGLKYDEQVKNTPLISRTSCKEDRPKGRVEKAQYLKDLASCAYEKNTQWGNKMGLKYGCPVEDVITGLTIQCRGWKSVYCNPERVAFLGLAPTTLMQMLVQHKRWSEGDFQIMLSKYSPVRAGFGRISPGLILGYLTYCLWVPNCIPTLYYSIVPSVCLLRGVSLYPEISSPWFVTFAYVIFAECAYSVLEFLKAGGTVRGWWNEQRMWLYKRTSSYLFALIDTVVRLVGFSETAFVITAKVADDDVSKRYKAEEMEFGATTPTFTLISTLALINLTCLLGFGVGMVARYTGYTVGYSSGSMFLQGVLCWVLVSINFPLYRGMFIRKDTGRMPVSTTVTSIVFAISACTCFSFLLSANFASL